MITILKCWKGYRRCFFSKSLAIFIMVLGLGIAVATPLPTEDEVKGIVRLCSAGQSNAVVANMNAAVSLWQRKFSADLKAEVDQIGAIFREIQSDSVASKVYENYVNCVQSSLKIFLEGKDKASQSFGKFFLPKEVDISPGQPLPILDGNVVVTVEKIWACGGKTCTNLRIEVPYRGDYKYTRADGEYMDFKYDEKNYRLTLSGSRLQRQLVKVSVREMPSA